MQKAKKTRQVNLDVIAKIAAIIFGLLVLYQLIFLFIPASHDFSANYINPQIGNKPGINIPFVNNWPEGEIGLSLFSKLRKERVDQVSQLAPASYKTRPEIFQITKAEAPWESLSDYYFDDRSIKMNIPRPAQAIGLENPYLLLYPDFIGLSVRSGLRWKKDQLTVDALKSAALPLHPIPYSIYWNTERKAVDVFYNLTQYVDSLKSYTTSALPKSNIKMNILSFNALDFGYMWGQFIPTQSQYISGNSEATLLYSGFGHDQSGCGLDTGCNVLIQFSKLNNFVIDKLPAKAVFYLWQQKPQSQDSSVNLTYNIYFN